MWQIVSMSYQPSAYDMSVIGQTVPCELTFSWAGVGTASSEHSPATS